MSTPARDLRTPGQVAFEIWDEGPYSWDTADKEDKENWEANASKVIATYLKTMVITDLQADHGFDALWQAHHNGKNAYDQIRAAIKAALEVMP